MEYLVSRLSFGMLELAGLHLASLTTRKEKSVCERKRNAYKGLEGYVFVPCGADNGKRGLF